MSETEQEPFEFDQPDENSIDRRLNQTLYENADVSVGEAVYYILEFFKDNCESKKGLERLIKLINLLLPKPNNLPKTKYHLMNLLEKLTPAGYEEIKKHRTCEECSHYLGEWDIEPKVTVCEACNSSKVNGMFVEYNIKSLIKNAFENRDLKYLIDNFKNSEYMINDPGNI